MANLSMKSAPSAVLAIAILAVQALAASPSGGPALPSPGFMRYWKSGSAENTSHAVTVEARGELRKAQAALIIVYEELDGGVWPMGTPRRMNMVPGLWARRERHSPLAFSEAIITKRGPEKFVILETERGRDKAPVRDALKWTLEYQGMTTTYFVEAAAPKRLLAWENVKGEKHEKGEMIASLRDTYWKHDCNADAPRRKKLGLARGTDGK